MNVLKKLIILYNISFSLSLLKSPILVVPGLGGSRLIKEKIDIWPPTMETFLFTHNNWLKTFQVNYNEKTNNFTYDTEVKTLEFGDKSSLDLHTNLPFIIRKNFFDDIINKNNVYPLPYDFRLIHNKVYIEELFSKIKNYIETFNEPITLLTHSSGGLIIHYFLINQSTIWKNKYIKNVININVPFGGVIITLSNLITNTYINLILGKKLLTSIGGFIINLPNNKIIKPSVISEGKEIENYYDFFKLDTLKIINENNKEMISSFSKSNNVNTCIIYTSELKTPSIIQLNNKKIKIIYGPGDGVVPLSSLLVPLKWKQQNLKIIHLPNFEHSNILFSAELQKIINEYI